MSYSSKLWFIFIYLTLPGYRIPKGWKVMPLFRNIHHNPEFFTDPQIFDPSRFEVCRYIHTWLDLNQMKPKVEKSKADKSKRVKFCWNVMQVAPKPNTYMPFGNGEHACPGNHLAKLEILIFLHHLLTEFRYHHIHISLVSLSHIKCYKFVVFLQVGGGEFWKWDWICPISST